MPSLVLIIGSLFIKAFSMWLKLQDTTATAAKTKESESKNKEQIMKVTKSEDFEVGHIASEILWSHIFGVAIMSSPKLFTWLGTQFWNLETDNSIYYGFASTTVLSLMWLLLLKR